MTFPSQHIIEWCDNINKLIKVTGNNQTELDLTIVFCECSLEKLVQFCPKDQQAKLVNGLFWSCWIDQVFYYITHDGGIRPYLRNSFTSKTQEVYFRFQKLYPFPKIHAHSGSGQISPQRILSSNMHYEKPNEEMLNNGKKAYWIEIKSWLKSIKRDDIINQMILAFREDIEERFDEKYKFLIEEL